MSAKSAHHPPESELLLFADGELSARKSAAVRAHLKACWQCRSQMEHLQETITAFIDYREKYVKPAIPPRPSPSRGLDARLREQLQGSGSSWWAALMASLRGTNPLVRTAVTGTFLAALALLVWLAQQPAIVSASEFLDRATAAQEPPSPARQAIRIRRGTQSAVREVWHGAGGKPLLTVPAAVTPAEEQLWAALDQVSWDPSDPLSVRSYRRWRDSVERESELVQWQEPGLLKLTTRAINGELAEVSLTVRAGDFHTVQENLLVRGEEEIEIKEISFEFTTALAPVGELAPPAAAQPTNVPPTAPSGETAFLRAQNELEAETRYALFLLGADMGEPVEVIRDSKGKVVVRAFDLAPERLQQLRNVLPRVPIVTEFTASTAATVPPASQVALPGAPLPPLPQVEAKFSSKQEEADFANQVLVISESALLHAHALRRLAERYPVAAKHDLSSATREHLREMRREHSKALGEDLGHIHASLEPLVPVPTTEATVGAAREWQEVALELFSAVQRLDRLVNVVLASANTELTPEQALEQLGAALAEASGRIKEFERWMSDAKP